MSSSMKVQKDGMPKSFINDLKGLAGYLKIDHLKNFMKLIKDVTGQKQASQYARSLIEASLDPLVTISADGKITDVNEALANITGLTRKKLTGTDFFDY